ncbi:hypothetical protein [Pseudobacteroides cellulosolvens]|uniref:DUF5659 domain-containing protein n=1 Tax=Pseudobacteroides cellulosolvens ATCC 35603 = DSM 2933 TaxID=398512 RepID=A0A0L6JGX5_9FIRM|nr:hypothetical protein [Pseudobacteroides cellulosolvens]KNY24978.1 hypothetical protein Bccel_0235 [Pseudobacteroides cellulosolvens ATCC 35603 = DSM 2933]
MQEFNPQEFKCTSNKLKNFLMDKGLRYEKCYVDDNGWTIWTFSKTNEFYKVLREWERNKKASI